MKKVFPIFSIIIFAIILLPSHIFAQSPTPTRTPDSVPPILRQAGVNPWVGTPEKLTQELNSNQVSLGPFISSTLSYVMATSIVSLQGEKICPTGQQQCYYQGGATQAMGNLTSMLYTKPSSSVEYFADIGSNLGIVKTAYAQGLGFSGFSPILTLWKTFRDMAYLIFVIIFIIIGAMIMFRKKLDPRTVVTVQEAIPKIVISLILITFSYAIAGLLIDIGDLLTKIIGMIFSKANIIAVTPGINQMQTLNDLYSNTVFELINPLRGVSKLVTELGGNIPIIANAPLGLGTVTVDFIFAIAGIFIMFKIFFALITPYVSIVISIIFSPFVLLMSAIPGQNNNLSSWIKGLLSKILVFPATFAMIAIAAALKGSLQLTNGVFGGDAKWDIANNSFQIGWYPATIGNWGSAVGDLISFAILFTIPNIVEMVQSALQVKPQPWESAAGGEIKSAASKIPIVGGYISRQMK